MTLRLMRQTHPEPGHIYRLMALWLRLPSSEINNLKELQEAFLDVSLENLDQINLGKIISD